MITFKSMQLVGFKSFADKTTISFDEGVTCIVGPNGCGKSNVADAIRWVLGEQSAKMMRGSQMMDVIFSGTEKRRKMSFCEVTLTFDNSQRVFDIDAPEVEMTRRLYRDGTSEYLLNRQPSRMKTLTTLLHGAGAAKEGYSIIGQGRIDQIMNAKPEDRRAIFEEATGISIFKERKAEVERRLASSRDNLYVFNLQMSEVEKQLTPLAKSAENTRKHREYTDQLRYHEVNTYIIRHDSAETDRNKHKTRIEKYTAKIEELSRERFEVLTEYNALRDEMQEADALLRSLNEQYIELSVGAERSTGSVKILAERAKAIKKELTDATDNINYALKRIGEIEREIKRIEEYSARNTQRIKILQQNSLGVQEQIDALNSQISEYDYMTSEHRQKVMDTFKDLSELKENMGSLAAQKNLLLERLGEMQAQLEKAIALREERQAEYDLTMQKSKELGAFLDDEDRLLEEAQKALDEWEEKANTLMRQIYDLQSRLTTLNQSLATNRALKDRFEGYTYSVRNLLNQTKYNSEVASKVKGLIADVVSTSEQYEVAIETAFGGSMQNIITQTREDARDLIEFLKRTRGGQVTFLPMDALRPHYENEQIKSAVKDFGAIDFAINLVKYDRKFENVIHFLLGNTLIVDNVQNATAIARRYPRAFKIVTLEGDIISTSGSMTGGSRRELTGNLLATERQIKEIEDEIEKTKLALEKAQTRQMQASEEAEKSEDGLNELRARLQASRLELAAIDERQAHMAKQLKESEGEILVLNESCRAYEERLSQLDSEYSGTSARTTTLSEQSTRDNSAVSDYADQYSKATKQRDELMQKLTNYNIEIVALESTLKANGENVERLLAERATLVDRVVDLKSKVPLIEKQLEEIELKTVTEALPEEDREKIIKIKAQIEQLNENKKTGNEQMRLLDDRLTQLGEEIEELKEKCHNAEIALAKIDSDLEFMQNRIFEEYGIDYDGCLSYKDEEYDMSQSAQAIANCKRLITMLGAVNPNAIEEYEEVNTRYQGMVSERDDLTAAIADLEVALKEIRDEMLKIFNSGFSIICENFKRTFKELFGGGNAELYLEQTEDGDPLNAGVEIIACPPGKSLKNISLLSGGERALTAIAILFAIITMRPMPFCVLDEIEAALDEANVGRYARFLKKFADQTQFIVITHRKPTMEAADILFGVTMEEKGVSRVVSVKLSEVQEKLGGDTVQ